MERSTRPKIINPEIPETADDKLRLLHECQDILDDGGEVEGVTPRHVTQDGMYLLGLMKRAKEQARSGL